MKRVLLTWLLLLLGGAAQAQDRDVPVRVVGLNLWHKKTDLAARTETTTRTLKALKPDLVGLQEVSGSWWRPNRAKLIGEALGYAWKYHKSDGLRPVFAEGLAVLSKRSLSADREKLPHSLIPPFERRFVQWAETIVRGQTVVLFNTHLTHHDGHGWQVERLEQALAALDAMARVALARDLPAVLVGDLNSSPHHLAIRALTGRLLGGPPPLLDAAAPAGNTVSPKNRYTPQERPDRIDYVLALRGTSRALVPRRARRIGVESNLSDHYGLVVDFALKPAPKAPKGARGARGALVRETAGGRTTAKRRAAGLRARIAAVQARIDRLRAAAREELREGFDDPVDPEQLRALVLKRVLAAYPASRPATARR